MKVVFNLDKMKPVEIFTSIDSYDGDLSPKEEALQILKNLKDGIDFLESHNKNYTKEQYYIITILQGIIKQMEISE